MGKKRKAISRIDEARVQRNVWQENGLFSILSQFLQARERTNMQMGYKSQWSERLSWVGSVKVNTFLKAQPRY